MSETAGFPESRWKIVDDLTNLKQHSKLFGSFILDKEPDLEACLSRVLRPHDEAGFHSPDDDWMIELRVRLDHALQKLTLREARNQLGLRNPELPAETRKNLGILFHSEAFLRYVNAYLYFGIRFLAGRPDEDFPQPPDNTIAPCSDSNTRPFALPSPPVPVGLENASGCFEEFVTLENNQSRSVETALLFLDDFHPIQQGPIQYELQEPSQYELYLRGLRPEIHSEQKTRFEQISIGLAEWACAHSAFYLSLNPRKTVPVQVADGPEEQTSMGRPSQGWLVTNPIAARLALADVYWIARLLRADVSAYGTVTYHKYNWLQLLRFHAVLVDNPPLSLELEKAEEALRSVFDFICDLIQNAVEITGEDIRREAEASSGFQRPETTWKWRAVFDEELDEIARQRRIRHFCDPSLPPEIDDGLLEPAGPVVEPNASAASEGAVRPTENAGQVGSAAPPSYGSSQELLDHASGEQHRADWSSRITTGEGPRNLIGLAFSGGGIRSATFNLGILQGLQELDLLRHIDYLSTVSGGGFIGSWLVANVRRTAHWLGRLTDWSDSIAHLRSHSNYLAPRKGILSADTWNVTNSWFRNAFLIQLTGLAWLFVLVVGTLAAFRLFLLLGKNEFHGLSWAGCITALAAIILAITIPYNLYGAATDAASGKSRRSRSVRRLAVTPGWIGACALASQLWANAPSGSTAWPCLYGQNLYSAILIAAWQPWRWILLAAMAGFLIIALFTLRRHIAHAAWISLLCTIVLYLELAGIFLLFRHWSAIGDMAIGRGFVFGPSLVLVAFSVCVLLLIGFTGRNSDEARREWWTRFGTWLAIFAGIVLFVSGISIYGPYLVFQLVADLEVSNHSWIKSIQWTAVLSWLGTVVGGVLAGKSSRTGGSGSPGLEKLAQAGGILFILASFLLGSSLLSFLMLKTFTSAPSAIDPAAVPMVWQLPGWQIALALAVILAIGLLFSWYFEINVFGLNQFYRNRLVRCYLGATRWTPGARKPNPFTGFDFRDDLNLWRFRTRSPGADVPRRKTPVPECRPYRGPLPILNCALNLGGSSDLALNTRHSASFSLTPLRCGCDRPRVGYAPTWSAKGSFANGVPLGQAVSISGAAVSSNMGYNTSPVVAFLLTMFNVRLGWWFPNPGQPAWSRRGLSFSLYYLLRELLGTADEKRNFLNVSDGGHFENLAVYELIRRRCKLIIACDAECDEALHFGSLGNMIRLCETDFGAKIDIDVKSIRPNKDGFSLAHCAVGTIKYSSGEIGRLIYLKACMTGDEEAGIAQYRSSHPSFPHESTSNQFYTEDQFESYRTLGLHIVRSSFRGNLAGDDPLMIAERMADVLTPSRCPSKAFLEHSARLSQLWDKLRTSPELLAFMEELITLGAKGASIPVRPAELSIGLELIQLMEDVFLDLRLDDFWEHPDNRGWAILFMRWARSPRFREIWNQTHRTFGIRFEYFCHARLGLKRDHSIVRV